MYVALRISLFVIFEREMEKKKKPNQNPGSSWPLGLSEFPGWFYFPLGFLRLSILLVGKPCN